jgi:hypothetical protein
MHYVTGIARSNQAYLPNLKRKGEPFHEIIRWFRRE